MYLVTRPVLENERPYTVSSSGETRHLPQRPVTKVQTPLYCIIPRRRHYLNQTSRPIPSRLAELNIVFIFRLDFNILPLNTSNHSSRTFPDPISRKQFGVKIFGDLNWVNFTESLRRRYQLKFTLGTLVRMVTWLDGNFYLQGKYVPCSGDIPSMGDCMVLALRLGCKRRFTLIQSVGHNLATT